MPQQTPALNAINAVEAVEAVNETYAHESRPCSATQHKVLTSAICSGV